jgi:hypothetical protein
MVKQKQDGLGNTDKYDQKQIVNVFNIMEEWDQLFFKPFEKVAFYVQYIWLLRYPQKKDDHYYIG